MISKNKIAKFVLYAYSTLYIWLATFFYSNENLEPIHIHAEKGDMECKFWLLIDEVEIKEAFAFNLTPAEKNGN